MDKPISNAGLLAAVQGSKRKRQPNATATGAKLVIERACDIAPVAVRWLWTDRLPLAKLTLIEGQPGLGKTLVVLDLAARISAGKSMPLQSVSGGEARDVLIISYEDDAADTIRPRLEAAGADLERCHIIHRVSNTKNGDRPFVLPEDLALLDEEIRSRGAALVVVDPLMAALSGSIDAHKDQDVRRALSLMRDLAEATGAAIVLVRHLRKATVGAAVLAGQGSIGIVGAARAAHQVAVDPGDADCRILAPVKSNVGRPARALRFRIKTNTTTAGIEAPCVDWVGECDITADQLTGPPPDSSERGAVGAAAAWLREELAEAPQATSDLRASANEAGISWTTIKRAKSGVGVEARKVGFAEGWMWGIDPKGPIADYWPPSMKKTNGHDANALDEAPKKTNGAEEDHAVRAGGRLNPFDGGDDSGVAS